MNLGIWELGNWGIGELGNWGIGELGNWGTQLGKGNINPGYYKCYAGNKTFEALNNSLDFPFLGKVYWINSVIPMRCYVQLTSITRIKNWEFLTINYLRIP